MLKRVISVVIGLLALASPAQSNEQMRWSLIGGEGINGSWTDTHHDRVRAIAEYRGDLYVGLGYNGADLYRLKEGQPWERVTGPWEDANATDADRQSLTQIKAGVSAGAEVSSLVVYKGELYAGLGHNGAQLWKFDGAKWSQIGSWPDATSVYTMAVSGDRLYLGFLRGSERASGNRLVSWDGSQLQQASTPWPSDVMWSYVVFSHGNELFVSTVREPNPGDRFADIWRFRNGSWDRIGGAGLNGSWNISDRHIATSMTWYNGALTVGLNCQSCSEFQHVWQFRDASWKVLGDGLKCTSDGEVVAKQRSFNAMIAARGKLFVAGGAASRTDAFTAWKFNGNWSCVDSATPESTKAWDEDDEYGYSLGLHKGRVVYGSLGAAHLFVLVPAE